MAEKMKKKSFNILIIIVILALFNFVFLGTEYLFDNMMMYVSDAKEVVISQGYVLGVSAIGFCLFGLVKKMINSRTKFIWALIFIAGEIAGVFVMEQHNSYGSVLIAGCIVFVMLGCAGSAVCYMIAIRLQYNGHLAKVVGVSYAIGLLLQFGNNNLINNDLIEAIVISAFILVWVILILGVNENTLEVSEDSDNDEKIKMKNPMVAAITLIVIVALMSCIFATLDNVVTLFHSAGGVDIGQLPRMILALSGLLAGAVFDIKSRRCMYIIMYCVTLLSTICVLIIITGGAFIIGLIVFYLSAGFFAVFFTTAFIELSVYMNRPEFWAGLGRAVNNICAAIIGAISLSLFESGNVILNSIVALILFVLISIFMFLYYTQLENVHSVKVKLQQEDEKNHIDQKEKFTKFSERFALTPREKEVLEMLLTSDENVQDIAGKLFISRAALYRHISNLNQKTRTKSRVGLLQFYYEWNDK